MLDWLIIGGGIHGTFLSHFLLKRMRVPYDSLRVLDPHTIPLTLWKTFAENTGMEFLRSSHAHNLHFDPFALRTFSLTQSGAPFATFTEPYGRPSFALFQAHSQHLIQRAKLDTLRITGRALGLTRLSQGWRIETEHGSLEARRVVLAIGATEQPYVPAWAAGLFAAHAPVNHIFDPLFKRDSLPEWSHAVVVGGGITAVQTALAMAQQNTQPVTLLMRHPIRVHSFDADPCWVGPRCLQSFHQTQDYSVRRAIIREARHRGSLPADVAEILQAAVTKGVIVRRMDQVLHAEITPQNTIALTLQQDSSSPLLTDRLILATGFDLAPPGGQWLHDAIAAYALPTASCGYPIVDKTLCWQRGLFVSGPLAELEIGPVSRNIIGAKLAAQRLESLAH